MKVEVLDFGHVGDVFFCDADSVRPDGFILSTQPKVSPWNVYHYYIATRDGAIVYWDGRCVQKTDEMLTEQFWSFRNPREDSSMCLDMRSVLDGNILVILEWSNVRYGHGHCVMILSLEDGTCLSRTEYNDETFSVGNTISSVYRYYFTDNQNEYNVRCISTDGTALTEFDHEICETNGPTKYTVRFNEDAHHEWVSLFGPGGQFMWRSDITKWFSEIFFSPDQSLIVFIDSDSGIMIQRTIDGSIVMRVDTPEIPLYQFYFSSHNRWVWYVSDNTSFVKIKLPATDQMASLYSASDPESLPYEGRDTIRQVFERCRRLLM